MIPVHHTTEDDWYPVTSDKRTNNLLQLFRREFLDSFDEFF